MKSKFSNFIYFRQRIDRIKQNKLKNYGEEDLFMKIKNSKEVNIIFLFFQKNNPWKRVINNINLSEYKGSKDVSRMKETIIGRKNDYEKLIKK